MPSACDASSAANMACAAFALTARLRTDRMDGHPMCRSVKAGAPGVSRPAMGVGGSRSCGYDGITERPVGNSPEDFMREVGTHGIAAQLRLGRVAHGGGRGRPPAR